MKKGVEELVRKVIEENIKYGNNKISKRGFEWCTDGQCPENGCVWSTSNIINYELRAGCLTDSFDDIELNVIKEILPDYIDKLEAI